MSEKKPAPPRPWTAEDLSLLKDLYADGKGIPYIAREMGRTTAAIKMRLSRSDIKRGPPPPQDRGRQPRKAETPRDISSRLAILLGEKPRFEAARREFTDEELLRFASGEGTPPEELDALQARFWRWVEIHNRIHPDPAVLKRLAGFEAYCREVVALELMDHQLAMGYLTLAGKRALCLAGRQSGKDVTQAALALWEALTAPNSRIVMVSGAQRQSDALMEKILGFVARSRETFDSILSSSREDLRFRNGSFVKALPATGLIRGETATRILMNEGRDVLNEEETYSALEPMLLTTGGSLALFTTPLGKSGRVWEAYNSPLYLKLQVPSTASKYATPEHLERQKLEMSAARYANEYEAEFLDIQSSFFSAESIARCVEDYDLREDPEEGKRYSLGIDWARTRDTSAMVVVSVDEDDRLRVEWLKGFFDIPFPDQVAYVRYLDRLFNFQDIISEYAGLGMGPSDQLRSEGFDVYFFKPTIEQKALGYDALKARFERGEITIPQDQKLLTELRTLGFKLTPSGSLTIHHPGSGSDDFVDATMMACWPWRRDAAVVETRNIGELFMGREEALEILVPAGQSQFDPRFSDSLRGGFGRWGEKMHNPRCRECGLSLRSGSHIKLHRETDCPAAGKEEI